MWISNTDVTIFLKKNPLAIRMAATTDLVTIQ